MSTMEKNHILVKGVVMPKGFLDMEHKIYSLPVRNEDVWISTFPKAGLVVRSVSRENKMISNYVKIKGVTMPEGFQDLEEKVCNFPVRTEDIWICTFPKSGTTWTQEMVWMIMHDLDFEGGKESLKVRSPFLEKTSIYDDATIKAMNKDYITDSIEYVKKQYEKGPVCIKTHLPWNLLPKQIQDGTKKPKIIYVSRNPKDVVVSYYYFRRLLRGAELSLEETCRRWLQDQYYCTPYWHHVLDFWNRRHEPNILFLKYEEMIKDLPSTIRKVAQFLGKSLTEEQVSKLSSHLNFQSMKNNPAVNDDDHVARLRAVRGLDKTDLHFIRSGKAGGYKEEISKELDEYFDKWIAENTKNTDFAV